RFLHGGVHVHRNAAPVVAHGAAAVGLDGDGDLVAVAGQRLVHRVVHDFVDQVVQAAHADIADVHGGPLAHRLETFEDGDAGGVVMVALGFNRQAGFSFCRAHRWIPPRA